MNQFESNETKRNELVSCEGWKAINRMGALAEMHNILSRNYTDLTNHLKALSFTLPAPTACLISRLLSRWMRR